RKARRPAVVLAHEDERHGGGDEEWAGCELHRLEGHQHAEPLALRAVADLVMVLQGDDEPIARQVGARCAARSSPVLGGLTLEAEPLRDRARQVTVTGEVAVVARRLAGPRSGQSVMEVVA